MTIHWSGGSYSEAMTMVERFYAPDAEAFRRQAVIDNAFADARKRDKAERERQSDIGRYGARQRWKGVGV